jgi:hypothetical protein
MGNDWKLRNQDNGGSATQQGFWQRILPWDARAPSFVANDFQ